MSDDESYIHDLTNGATLGPRVGSGHADNMDALDDDEPEDREPYVDKDDLQGASETGVDDDELWPADAKSAPETPPAPKELSRNAVPELAEALLERAKMVVPALAEALPAKKADLPKPTSFAGIPIATVRNVGSTVNILVYGRPGVGKTYWAAGADLVTEMGPVLYISAEAGSSTIKQVAPNMMIIPDPAVRGSVTWEEFEAIYNELHNLCYSEKGNVCPYKTIVIDTITELQKSNMDWVMRQTLADHPDRDPDVPALHDWGKSTNRMRLYLRQFRDLPLNLICVAHEQEDRDNRGTLWRKPDLPGKLGNQSAAFFDQVMYLYTKQEGDGKDGQAPKTKRVLMTGALEGFVTKDRSGNLPLLVVDPNMSDIYKMITKG